ncbi:Ku protein [Streptomyces sp. NPDC048629]|uniref:non-homologous end joining protein Ku n=1 Tax=Streptomyces sp. NPDC048629 TaxID=3154824 RepID=UPI003429BFD3
MPHALWSGAISFGLVTLPCKLESATESHSIAFRQIHTEDGGRIRYRKVCELDGQELPEEEIGKGYEVSRDNVIPITDEDLAGMPLPSVRAIEIVSFQEWSAIDQRHLGEASYYVSADGPVSAKPYTLLREALGRTQKVAVAKVAMRGRERLALLRPVGDVLVLHTMRWDDEIRDPSELAPDAVDLTDEEVEGALALMETMTVEHLADLELVDHYRDALAEVIEAKAEHRPPQPVSEAPEPAGHVVDLMAALEASVQEARERRGETGGQSGTVHEMPKKKPPAKKKATAKKTTAKKTAPARRRKSA